MKDRIWHDILFLSLILVPGDPICVSLADLYLYNNQFIFSPAQNYAAGMMNNQFGVYRSYSNTNVTSSTTWTASQTSTSQNAYLALQADRNLAVYTVSGNAILWSANKNNGGIGKPFCLQMTDTGLLRWIDSNNTYIWTSNPPTPPVGLFFFTFLLNLLQTASHHRWKSDEIDALSSMDRSRFACQ